MFLGRDTKLKSSLGTKQFHNVCLIFIYKNTYNSFLHVQESLSYLLISIEICSQKEGTLPEVFVFLSNSKIDVSVYIQVSSNKTAFIK